jgi:hypothetical protein
MATVEVGSPAAHDVENARLVLHEPDTGIAGPILRRPTAGALRQKMRIPEFSACCIRAN